MFTIEQIQAIHSKVKSGADFPRYVQDLIQLGVSSYDNYVDDGRAVYFGKENFTLTSKASYPLLEVALKGDKQQLEHALKIHQQGQTDYLTFCKQAAESGVEKWVVDMKQMSCAYYDRQGHLLVVETIPYR